MVNHNLDSYVDQLWDKLQTFLNGALVYMDDCTAECLHWNGGLQYFLKLGAHVKRFEFSVNHSGYWDDVVFILSGPVVGEVVEVVKEILTKNQFIKCTLVSSDPNRGNPQESTYHSLKENLLQWMGSKKFEANMIYLPVFMACISSSFFVMPPFAQLFPPLEVVPSVVGPNKNETQKYCFSSTSDEILMKALAFCLDSFLSDMNVKEDIFVWGQLSHAVGQEMLKLPNARNRRKSNGGQRASFLLLDRTVDLSPSLSHQCDCILDNIVRSLPPLDGHVTCDVNIDMTPLLYPDAVCIDQKTFGVPPGCLAGKGPSSVLEAMITSKTKECLMELNRQLVSAGSKRGVNITSSGGRITPESLLQKVQAFRSSPTSILECEHLLQQTLAVVECLKSSLNEKESLMLSTERLLVQNLTASQEGPTRNLLHIMAHMKDRNMTLEDIVIILAYLYAVCDSHIWKMDDEVKLQGALAEAVFQDLEKLPPFFKNLVGDTTQESNVLAAVSQTFKTLKTIGKGKQNFRKYKSVLSQENPALPATYRSVFQQLLTDVLDPTRPEITDLQCISTGITDMLKSGLGLFMNVSKPHPQDNPLLIVIVLGGMTASEVKSFKDTVTSRKKSCQLIVGTTKICKPGDILESIFQL